MGRATPIPFGPFIGGVNTYSDPSAIADNELVDCVNMELDLDGSLVCRPVIRKATKKPPGATARFDIIGQGVWTDDINGNVSMLFATGADGLFYLNAPSGDWINIGTSSGAGDPTIHDYNHIFQCGNVVVAVPNIRGHGGYWSPSLGWVSDPNIPAGEKGIFFKNRLWVVPGPNPSLAWAGSPTIEESRLRFTEPLQADITPSTKPDWKIPGSPGGGLNSIDVSRGDGQDLIDVVIYQDQLLLFKTNSTYVYAFETDPLTTGLLRVVDTSVGATTRHCVAEWRDMVYVIDQGSVYEIQNYTFTKINEKVPFLIDGSSPIIGGTEQVREVNVFMCTVEDRLIVRYWNRIYTYGLLTKTWWRWEGAKSAAGAIDERLNNFGMLAPFPDVTLRNTPPHYFSGSVLRDQTFIFELIEKRDVDVFATFDGTTRLDIECTVVTKVIDMEDPFNFKKLAWWGVDVISGKDVEAVASPIVRYFKRSWASLSTIPWEDLVTWDRLTEVPYFEVTEVIDGSATGRKFIKLRKALRFRQIYFTVTLHSDGSTLDGPARLFKIIPWIGQKETVVKQVS